MKNIIIVILTLNIAFSFSQEKEKQDLAALKKANDYVYEGNQLSDKDDFVAAEMEYRKAISKDASNTVGAYNLANSYYKKGSFDEALYRQQEVVKTSTSKAEKHKAFHNIGNILMKNKKCKEAVEAYKNALRNDPTDEETRYNLGLAKECAEQQKDQQDQNKDNKDNKDNQDKKDENKDKQDQKDKEGDNKDDQKDKGDQDKKEGDDKKDEDGKPKDEKQDQDKGKQDDQNKDQQKPQPQPGKLSDQQIKSLLEAMNNQEQKVQEKMNAEKQKGVKVKTDKDW
ncbi:tetratricopeptide repeat protein [Gaetbulibacter sp. M235]|uniref:tetratricopeptide repeat protein n=1 Tax=Gaetbulibacter sp. M235 TaxID=3126510 RepID=UPI00374EE52C